MGRFIVVVLDGFGVGAMNDVLTVRPQDNDSNTALKLVSSFSDQKLPTLERLGLMNILNTSTAAMKLSDQAVIGKADLMHVGADTFMGHQEIMGTRPCHPVVQPFQSCVENVRLSLRNHNYRVQKIHRDGLVALLVEGAIVVGDNLEADLGQVYNITANLNKVTFEEATKIANVVRGANDVGRNIVFGGLLNSSADIINAIETKSENGISKYIGVNSPKSGVYKKGFQVRHIGYGVDSQTQVPEQLHTKNVKTYLYGKVADIISNRYGISYESIVDTDILFLKLTHDLNLNKQGFFCLNIQETDLAGHQQDANYYWQILHKADYGLSTVIKLLSGSDHLIVMADHGNDPYIGHSHHTREQVPLMIYNKNNRSLCDIGVRKTLSDVGATVCDYFKAPPPENGKSFLKDLF